MRRFLNILPVILLLLILLVAVVSWIGNVYGWNCRNILSGEGMRWAVDMIMENFSWAPWNYVVLGTATLSMVNESGIISGFSKQKYLRQRRAYALVGVVLGLMAMIVILLSLLPGNTLLSAFGTFSHSALQRGLFPLISIALFVLSLIYAFAIGRFNSIDDVVKATVNLPVRIAGYFITMFVASQLISVLLYAFFIDYTPAKTMPVPMIVFAACLYGIPLVLHCLFAIKNHE